MIMFVHVVYVLVFFVIYFFRNLFVNNDCVFFFVAMKRIETVKNRVKTELEISVQVVDVKRQEFAEIFDTKHKELK